VRQREHVHFLFRKNRHVIEPFQRRGVETAEVRSVISFHVVQKSCSYSPRFSAFFATLR
jgi:hypothetical protein